MAISLAAATFLRLALDAKEAGDSARFAECIASIDQESWESMRDRFNEPLDWILIAEQYAALPTDATTHPLQLQTWHSP